MGFLVVAWCWERAVSRPTSWMLPPCDLQVDGQRVAAAIGAAPEHPLDAVAWMANHLARRNRRLEPGMLLLCGTHLPALSIAPGQHVALYMGPVGQVDLICD